MEKNKTHLKLNADNVAIPEVQVVTDETENATNAETEAQECEKKIEEAKTKKVKTHIVYDTLAVPEIEIDLD